MRERESIDLLKEIRDELRLINGKGKCLGKQEDRENEVEAQEIDFHTELKLTFDALRNSALAASLLVAGRYVVVNPDKFWNCNILIIAMTFIFFVLSFYLQFANCYSYLKQLERKAKYWLAFCAGAIIYIFIMFVVYMSVALPTIQELRSGA